MIKMFKNSTTNMQKKNLISVFHRFPKNSKEKKHNVMMLRIYHISLIYDMYIIFYNIYCTIMFARFCNSSVITDILFIYIDAKSMYIFI